jgi:hypothetical protein
MVYGRVRYGRTWQRQWNPRGNFSGPRFAHIPLAHTVTLAAFGEIQMYMCFMVTIGAGPEHGRKAMACALA